MWFCYYRVKNLFLEFSGGYDFILFCVLLLNYVDGFEDNYVKVLVLIDKIKIKERVIFVGIRWI